MLHVLRAERREIYLFQTPSRSRTGEWFTRPHERFVGSERPVDRNLVFGSIAPSLPAPAASTRPAGSMPHAVLAAIGNVIDWNVAAPALAQRQPQW